MGFKAGSKGKPLHTEACRNISIALACPMLSAAAECIQPGLIQPSPKWLHYLLADASAGVYSVQLYASCCSHPQLLIKSLTCIEYDIILCQCLLGYTVLCLSACTQASNSQHTSQKKKQHMMTYGLGRFSCHCQGNCPLLLTDDLLMLLTSCAHEVASLPGEPQFWA
jgi:hypothetical protein